MTSSTFEIGQVHVAVEVDSATLPTRLANALRAAGNSPVVKAEMRNLNKKIAQGIGKVKVELAPDISVAALRIAKAKIDREVGTISVTAKITKVIKPVPPPVIDVTANIVNTRGGGRGGRGGAGRDRGFEVPPQSWLKWLKGLGSGGFFEGITTAIAHLFELARLPGKLLSGGIKLFAKGIKGLGSLITKAGDALSLFSSKLFFVGENIAKLGGLVGKLGSAFSALAGPIGIAVQAAGAVAALLFLAKGITLLAPLVANVAGAFTLFAGALFNAAAAGVIFLPMLAALGIGLGVAVVAGKDAVSAFGAMTKAITSGDAKDMEAYAEALEKLGPNARAAVKAAEPLVKTFKGLRGEMEQRLFKDMAEQIKGLQPLLEGLRAPLLNIAEAAGNVADKILQMLQAPQIRESITALFIAATPIIENFGTVVANVVGGVISFFGLLSGEAVRVSGDIKAVSDRFLEWVQSEDARQKILDFFHNAWNIAKQVADIIGTLGQIILSVFTQTQKPLGENEGILARINTKLNDWLEWVQSEQGQRTIHGWLEKAAEFAADVWHAVEQIVQKFAEWNTPENHAALKKTAETLKDMALAGMNLVTFLSDAFDWLWKIAGMTAKLNPLLSLLQKIAGTSVPKGGSTLTVQSPRPTAPRGPSGPGFNYAAGGIVSGPRFSLIGEAGPEAIIPLSRPLALVDPSVRAMAAMLRSEKAGTNPTPAAASSGRTFNVTQNIQLAQADPQAAAASVVNRLVAAGFR